MITLRQNSFLSSLLEHSVSVEDEERNDGSEEKPYFMSKDLRKILGKKNQTPKLDK